MKSIPIPDKKRKKPDDSVEKEGNSRTGKRQKEKCPRLNNEQVRRMLDGEEGYYYTFSNGWMVPYALPFNRFHMVCPCSAEFNNADSARCHLRNFPMECVTASENRNSFFEYKLPAIEYKSEEYNNLVTTPQFFLNMKGNLCLRMHPQTTTVSCVCGQIHSFEKMKRVHSRTCPLLQKIWLSLSINPSRKSVCNKGDPFVAVYRSAQNVEEKIFINIKNTTKTKNRLYLKYKPYQDDSVVFMTPRNNELPKDVRKKIFCLDNSIHLKWENLIQMIVSSSINGSQKNGYDCYEVKLDFGPEGKSIYKSLCASLGIDTDVISDILEFAKQQTVNDIGSSIFPNGNVSSPLLQLYKTNKSEPLRMNMNTNKKTFCYTMMLNNLGKTSLVVKPDSEDRIDSMSTLMNVVKNDMCLCGHYGGQNNNHLHSLVDKIVFFHENSFTKSNGFCPKHGDLFSVGHREHLRETQRAKCKNINGQDCSESHGAKCKNINGHHWTSAQLCSAPTGTIIKTSNHIIQSRAGAQYDDIQAFISWNWELKESSDCGGKEEINKFTFMISVAQDIWPELKKEERQEMIKVLFYCYETSLQEQSYPPQNPFPGSSIFTHMMETFSSINLFNREMEKEKILETLSNINCDIF